MKWTMEQIKTAQQFLQQQSLLVGNVDGIPGPKTRTALGLLSSLPVRWDTDRKLTGCIQLYCKQSGYDPGPVDGIWGPETQRAFNQLSAILIFPPAAPAAENVWPLQTQTALNRFYGAALAEHNPNLITYAIPYPFKLAWDTTQTVDKITTHYKVKDSILRVLNQVLDHYGLEDIDRLHLNHYGGCFQYRKTRNGTTLSTHSWGIALDFDPERNQLKWGRDKAAFAGAEYEAWWQFWEKEGWVSLGRTRNYDWMHVQAARLSA
ncbi:M15 family metallopeptidase domain-containing protein [Edaphocola flava]|uniref:M15 family metallopeptidase n=1 Tax=Edaphocola flava TaxID=2499629 RepID=UPI00192A273D|nr:M15 family metallopeptidase [Edaphocola flava]